ncbi:hypothetical protein LPJ75_004542, partial [Coemansia sp. RSA 2598]
MFNPEDDLSNDFGEYASDDNEALEADVSFGKRRDRRVNVDGYGSEDSDQDEVNNLSDYSDDEDEINDGNDNEDDGANDESGDMSRHAGSKNMDDDGDFDMFGDSTGPFSKDEKTREKKRKRYLDISEIQGQEMDSQSRVENKHAGLKSGYKGKQQQVAVEESDDEGDEGEGKVRIEAFNMKDDLEEGRFDAQGNFVWNKKDPQMHQDSWLEGISKAAMSRARESKAKQDSRQTDGEKSTSLRWDSVSNDDVILAIINNLRPGETILAALARIGGPKKKDKSKKGKKQKEAKDSEKERERRREIEQLTELADQAMARGMINIYDETFEQLVRQMRIAERIDDDWAIGSLLATPAMPS